MLVPHWHDPRQEYRPYCRYCPLPGDVSWDLIQEPRPFMPEGNLDRSWGL